MYSVPFSLILLRYLYVDLHALFANFELYW